MIKVEDVRISLAAAVGSRLFFSLFGDRGGARILESFQHNMRNYLERCCLQAEATEKSRNIPEWAIDVYANYLWGWTRDSIPADPELIGFF